MKSAVIFALVATSVGVAACRDDDGRGREARGGGPPAPARNETGAVYGVSSAVDVLISARCPCDQAPDCEQRTAHEFHDLVTLCVRGVRADALSSCARAERRRACGDVTAGADVCAPERLCARLGPEGRP
jgi:predicted small secreted protein